MKIITLRSRREGFALPMAILLIGFLTAGLVGAFLRQSSEQNTVASTGSQADAFAVAQEGLETYLGTGTTGTTTVNYTFANGTATVIAKELKPSTSSADSAIWVIRSTGTANGGTPTNPAARRTVAQIAYKASTSIQVLSAWTSLTGIDKNGNSGSIAGADACGTGVVKAGATEPSGMASGKTGPFSGNPAIDQTMTQTQLAGAVKIDWAGITSTSSPAIAADIIYCKSGTSGYSAARTPCGSFPSASSFTSTYWPTIIINGSSGLPADGHGMLIVTGDLTLGGGDRWDGVILVGGILTDNGNGGVGGAVVTGLNIKLGQTVGQSSKANGTKAYSYNSCNVASATSGLAKLIPANNVWMDNWNSW